jgi:hypothetical protein
MWQDVNNRKVVFYCGWEIPGQKYMWLISSYNQVNETAFGWSLIGNLDDAEFGAIDIQDLRDAFNKFKGTDREIYAMTEAFAHGPLLQSSLSFIR